MDKRTMKAFDAQLSIGGSTGGLGAHSNSSAR